MTNQDFQGLENKIVVVTGGASGIGKAISQQFAKNHARVVIADINHEDALELAVEIKDEFNSDCQVVETDVSNYQSMLDLFKNVNHHFGKLDVLINNAGIGPTVMQKTAHALIEDWDRVIGVNQTGVFYGMKLALTQMEKQGYGNIINIASLAGIKASGNNIAYSASKFAVVGMTKSAALEYAKKNIRINAVCPGYTQSPLLDRLLNSRPDMDQLLLNYIPMKRFGEPNEIAEACLWLASDQSSFITGQSIVLDGGTSL